MAIYHCHMQNIDRGSGRSVIAAMAYRTASRMIEEIVDSETGIVAEIVHDYRNKSDVHYTEVMTPTYAPEWMRDREQLWLGVTAKETRKNSRFAREVEVAIPIELNQEQGVELVRRYVQETFVDEGIIADVAVHWKEGNPHAHIMLTTREINGYEFGKKNRTMDRRSFLYDVRKAWAEVTNLYLLEKGIQASIDHRSYAEQGIALAPTIHEGPSSLEMDMRGIEHELQLKNEQIKQQRIEQIERDPSIIIRKLSKQQATFTKADIAKEIFTMTLGDDERFDRLLNKVLYDESLVQLDRKDLQGNERYAAADYVQLEQQLFEDVEFLADKPSRPVKEDHITGAIASAERISDEQASAVHHLTNTEHSIAALVGRAGTGKTTTLKAVVQSYQSMGYQVQGMALSGIAARNLGHETGISSRTIASYQKEWQQPHHEAKQGGVFIIDEAGMVDVRTMQAVIAHAKQTDSKVILVGDNDQLQPIMAGQAFREIVSKIGASEISKVFRQQDKHQQRATEELARGQVGTALSFYGQQKSLHFAEGQNATQEQLIRDYLTSYLQNPDKSRIVLAYTRNEIKQLNQMIRDCLKDLGVLEKGKLYQTEKGKYEFSVSDRIIFLKNEYRDLNIRNGTTGVISGLGNNSLKVTLDDDNREVIIDTTTYQQFSHGYVSTVHKAQGITVDESYVLASKYLDMSATYVALSRHRESMNLYADKERFPDINQLTNSMSKTNIKELSLDFSEDEDDDQGELRQRVKEYLIAREEVIELTQEMNDFVDDTGDSVSSFPKLKHLKEATLTRHDIAKEIISDMAEHRRFLKEAGIHLETLKTHAGKERQLTEFEQKEQDLTKEFATKFHEASHLWKKIREESDFGQAKSHPDYEKFSSLRSERNKLADSLVTKRVRSANLYHQWLKEEQLSWKQVQYCAKDHIKRYEHDLANADWQDHVTELTKWGYSEVDLKSPEYREYSLFVKEQITDAREDLQATSTWLTSHDKKIKAALIERKKLEWNIQTREEVLSYYYQDPEQLFTNLMKLSDTHSTDNLKTLFTRNPKLLGKMTTNDSNNIIARQAITWLKESKQLETIESTLDSLSKSNTYQQKLKEKKQLEHQLGRFVHEKDYIQLEASITDITSGKQKTLTKEQQEIKASLFKEQLPDIEKQEPGYSRGYSKEELQLLDPGFAMTTIWNRRTKGSLQSTPYYQSKESYLQKQLAEEFNNDLDWWQNYCDSLADSTYWKNRGADTSMYLALNKAVLDEYKTASPEQRAAMEKQHLEKKRAASKEQALSDLEAFIETKKEEQLSSLYDTLPAKDKQALEKQFLEKYQDDPYVMPKFKRHGTDDLIIHTLMLGLLKERYKEVQLDVAVQKEINKKRMKIEQLFISDKKIRKHKGLGVWS